MAIVMMIPMKMFGDSFDSLWKQFEAASDKDLPQKELEVLSTIVNKATRSKEYGQLLKAELMAAQVRTDISPDSLAPAVGRLKERASACTDIPLKAVYNAVLGRIYQDNSSLSDSASWSSLFYTKAMENPDKLAAVKAGKYCPLVVMGRDSRIYNNDLLSVIGMWTDNYRVMHEYYDAAGNRSAACLTALELASDHRPYGTYKVEESAYLQELDSLIKLYSDVPEVGEVVIERFDFMNSRTSATARQKIEYIDDALTRFSNWKRMAELRNSRKQLTASQFTAALPQKVMTTHEQQTVKIKRIRNVSEIKLNIYRVAADGTITLDPSNPKDYDKLKTMLTPLPELTQTARYTDFTDYDLHDDTLTIGSLPAGVYMIEALSTPLMKASRSLLHVSDVRLLTEPLPGKNHRYVVVDATTGHPLAGAHIDADIYKDYSYKDVRTVNLVADADGECQLALGARESFKRIFVFTDNDKARPANRGDGGRYSFTKSNDNNYIEIYTDRSIYRPGQTVHAAAITYSVTNSIQQKAMADVMLDFELRDANYNLVSKKSVPADKFGTAAADFVLPSSGLTGDFTLRVGQSATSFRVEEYKRPTFEAAFDKVDKPYQVGDTVAVKAVARTFAGVPVQGGKVSWRIKRQHAWWWWRYSNYYETAYIGHSSSGTDIADGETTTGADGSFTIDVPMLLPESEYATFYTFIVTADITDQGGETHSCETQLNLGNRKTAFGCTLQPKVLIDEKPEFAFTYYNASGFAINGDVSYRLDGSQWQKAKTNTQIQIPAMTSGKHLLEAVCGTDSIERHFVVFSLDDKSPAIETEDWFYQSASAFTNDGKPVTVQTGSSDSDVYIIYNVFSGDKVLESGHVMRTNELINRKLTYREDYGDAVLLTYAWVKNGKMYHHTATISRPLPDKQLKLEWHTFRDRLTPGQKEEWTLRVEMPPTAADNHQQAQLMATLYDYSLDQLYPHNWWLSPRIHLTSPHTDWAFTMWSGISLSAYQALSHETVDELVFSTFDESLFPTMYGRRRYGGMVYDMMPEPEAMMVGAASPRLLRKTNTTGAMMAQNAAMKESADEAEEEESKIDSGSDHDGGEKPETVATVRENLQETAFFYPQLVTDANGMVSLKFTLPESLTTWRFMGLAHTADMYYGQITGKAVAQKDVMVQPNVPRFLREGDEATVSARLFNTGGRTVSGTARMELLDPETNNVVYTKSEPFTIASDATAAITFTIESGKLDAQTMSLLVCRVMAEGKGFSDGEQHYLPVLPSRERVTVSRPFTQNNPGTTKIDLTTMVPSDATGGELTVEYTNNPAWLMVQALPTMAYTTDDNAISQAASLYANTLGKFILSQIPNAKRTFELWQKEKGTENSLTSNLEKNQELKDILIGETPWVMEATRETEQMHRLADFFDENRITSQTASAIEKLEKLQLDNGAWTWWEGMNGSFWITVEIAEMLVRLNAMTGTQADTRQMLSKAMSYMQGEIADEVKELKKKEKKYGEVSFPSYKCLQYLYICALDGRKLSSKAEADNKYLIELLRKDIKQQDLYDKAITAIILERYDRKAALEYVQSLKQYTVYTEEKGRYYDSRRASYSWMDYRIPTQVAAIEAIGRLTPDDRQTLTEMQRWLLQEKRTTSWSTPINSVNAVYAFLTGNKASFAPQERTRLSIDGKPLELPKATAGLGYVKTKTSAKGAKTLTAEKTSEGISWGAVYAQFMQHTANIADSGSGITVSRQLFVSRGGKWEPLNGPLKVGERIKVRITIEGERDYDFVQVLDRRAACMEPVRQLSGYNGWAYVSPRDCSTNYYLNMMPKGKRIIETEYFVDRAGTYETGTCTVECAYSPEYRAKTKSVTLHCIQQEDDGK